MHRTRVVAGGLTGDELAVDNYDDLTVSEACLPVHQPTDTAALTALLRYEQNHKDRAGALPPPKNGCPHSLSSTSAEVNREHQGPAGTPVELLREVPVRLFVFDILTCDGEHVASRSYVERRDALTARIGKSGLFRCRRRGPTRPCRHSRRC